MKVINRKKVYKEFEIGHIYCVRIADLRKYFKVTDRTSKTVTFEFLGGQNAPGYVDDKIEDTGEGEAKIQKGRIGLIPFSDSSDEYVEYSHVTIKKHFWDTVTDYKADISSKNDVTRAIAKNM